ncbi:DUF4878 domain-containing protein [Serpentinicella sp. ANB-PHB4]|uniref:DUF4878 domain-containing protein n=1 Tax=Serpentinicella sp. ANB-PHB4 TaxID=3074076 RepID=UPI002859602F|nr:DUF4878 domain-containing protein [Serpentinicella sp. ANB-PHB4]MDR5659493.1 DUF4878 domain-containing protein [Serpentinicella sp. ANB-PHB4]
MFCSQCGNQLKPSASFCTKCGNQIKAKKTTKTSIGNINLNKKVVMGIVAALILSLVLIVVSGNRNTPESAVNNLFRAIERGNASQVMNLMAPSELEARLEWFGSRKEFENMLSEELGYLSEELEEELGRGWSSNIEIETISESEERATVELTFTNRDGHTGSNQFHVRKVDGKWIADLESIFWGFGW